MYSLHICLYNQRNMEDVSRGVFSIHVLLFGMLLSWLLYTNSFSNLFYIHNNNLQLTLIVKKFHDETDIRFLVYN